MRIKKIYFSFITIGIICIFLSIVLLAYNIWMDSKADYEANKVKLQLEEEIGLKNGEIEDEEINTIEINGKYYIGIIEFPSLNTQLPVMKEWDDKLSKITPCRYKGSVKENSLIIAGHDYKSQFGKLFSLSIGDQVLFKDTGGMNYIYTISKTETIDEYDLEKIDEGEWDLTLFTCTIDGKKRLVYRCKL